MAGGKRVAEEPKYESGKLYHISLDRKDVGGIALLPGDPDRVQRIAERFSNAKQLASHREYQSYGGYVGNRYVVAMSTGIGGPSAAIAIEELARLGVKTMIRIGTCGSITSKADVGSLVIADAAVRLDGTTDQYVMKGYPAAASYDITNALVEAARSLKKKFVVGATASSDSFYVGQGRKGFNGYYPDGAASLIRSLQSTNVACFEMEASTLFTLGRIYGIRTGAIFAVIANRTTGGFRVDAGVDDAIDTAVLAIRTGIS